MIYNPFIEEEIINNYESKTYSWRAWFYIKINDRTVYSERVEDKDYTVIDVQEFVYKFMDKFNNNGIELLHNQEIIHEMGTTEINYEINGFSQRACGNIEDIMVNSSVVDIVKLMFNDYEKAYYRLKADRMVKNKTEIEIKSLSYMQAVHKGGYIIGSEEFEKKVANCEIVEADYFDKQKGI